MNLETIQKKVLTASRIYHRESALRQESIQIAELPFRLWRTLSEDGNPMNNYLVKTGDNHEFIRF